MSTRALRAKVSGRGSSNALNSASAKKYQVTPSDSPRHGHHATQFTVRRGLHLLHRFTIFVMASIYVVICFGASYTATELLRGKNNPWNALEDDFLPLIAGYTGSTTVREGPLVQTVLGGSTTPRSGTVYLYSATEAGSEPCPGMTESEKIVLGDTFMRSLYDAIVDGVSYNVTEIAASETELVAPVVDCQSTLLGVGEVTSMKFLFLVRKKRDPNLASVLVVYQINQQFKSAEANGATAFATIQLIDDMRRSDMDRHFHYIMSLGYPFRRLKFRKYTYLNTTDEGLLTLQLMVPQGARESVRTVQTGCREGFYIKGETQQANINNYQWLVEANATNAVGRWRWISKPVLHDSWGWVHGVQFFIGMYLFSHLSILCLTTFHNFRSGRLWIGDAYLSMSSAQILCSAAVLVSWYMNEFWSVREFAFATAFRLSDAPNITFYDSPIRADLLTLYLGACALTGKVCRERVNPLFASFWFIVGFDLRVPMLKAMPSSQRQALIEYSKAMYRRNVFPRVAGQDKISPMDFWSCHPLQSTKMSFMLRCFSPLFVSLAVQVGYVILRKIYRHFFPDKLLVQQNTTDTAKSENESVLVAQKRVLTLFEIATGGKLLDRFGVLSDFQTFLFIRGTKYASPDGIYSNGFVIANKKYLVQTSDYWTIVLMKILGRRFRNVYVYDVDGSTVKQTARLVYPSTFSVADLVNIDVRPLS